MNKMNIPLMGTLLLLSIVVCPLLYFTVGPTLDGTQLQVLKILGIIAACSAAFCFFVGEATGNNSQMDKLWSLLPIVYTWVIAAKGGMSPRLVIMAVLATLWGARLTFNFARKGAYKLKFWEGVEDYRWAVVRSGPAFNKRWKWALFDLGFISIYQNALVLMTTFPALVAMRSNAPLGWMDAVAGGLMLLFIVWESVADEQQWAFQTRKWAMIGEGRKLPELPAPYDKGFNTLGLWGHSRHPNYFAEQAIWAAFYLFSVAAGMGIINWSIIGALLLIVLFQGSSALAEAISSGKYPEYEKYCRSVPRFFPGKKYQGGEAPAVVYFTRNLSAEGLIAAYEKVDGNIRGKVGIKLHTGEPNGPNIIPREWVKALIEKKLPDATIIETNTYYDGDRYTTEAHRKTLEVNGWTFCPVDILDEEGTILLPVKGGKWFREMSVGSHLTRYDSMVTLTHFKGHVQGGFGGADKNIGIGCADGRIGKAWIHTTPGQPDQWDIRKEEFMERMTESTKATIDHFGQQVTYVNVMRNMSVSCDCEGIHAAPVVTPNVGILSSTDILAIDQACIDIVYAMKPEEHHDLVERIETRHGLRQLSYMKELGMGRDRYILIDLDNGGKVISAAEAAKGLKPFPKTNHSN